MTKDRRFFRILFSLGVMLFLAIVIGGVAKILVFLNDGGDRATLLNIPKELPTVYNPKIDWLKDDEDTGRAMEEFNRSIIANDYVKALYQRNLGIFNNQNDGINEYYSLTARPKLFHQISLLKKSKSHIEKAEMNHNLKLHFYAADGQIVTFTDHRVENRVRYYDDKNQRLFSAVDEADYNVIMVLEDGFWKIKSMERIIPEPFEMIPEKDTLQGNTLTKNELVEEMRHSKGINYYPQKTPWKDFWIKYDSSIVEKDLAIIKSFKFNSIRIFINYEQFGKGIVVPEMMLRLDHLMQTAKNNNLKVLITLFDFNSNYQLLNFPSTDRQLETLLKRYRHHEALLAWDLKNEPDLDYHYQVEADVREWLVFMVRQAKIYDPYHPIGIGWAYPENANFLSDSLDFVAFHYYKDPKELEAVYDTLAKVAKGKPIVLEEFGLSNYQSTFFPFGKSQKQQAKYLLEVMNIFSKKGNNSFFYWTLYDFDVVSGDIAGNRPWQKGAQKYFGILDAKGKPKMVSQVITGDLKNIQIENIDKIQPFWFTYLIFGFIFVILYQNKNRFKKYISKFKKKKNKT